MLLVSGVAPANHDSEGSYMPRLLIHKEGENATIESPEMGPLACERQREGVESVISIAHREGGVEQAR